MRDNLQNIVKYKNMEKSMEKHGISVTFKNLILNTFPG